MHGFIRLCSTSIRRIKYNPPIPLPSRSPSPQKTTPLPPPLLPKPLPGPHKPLPQPSVNKE